MFHSENVSESKIIPSLKTRLQRIYMSLPYHLLYDLSEQRHKLVLRMVSAEVAAYI